MQKKITKGFRRVAILGAGNIGLSIAETFRGQTTHKVRLTRKNGKFSREERERFECLTNNRTAVKFSDIVVVAVKPTQLNALLSEIKGALTGKKLLISVVSGVSLKQIQAIVGKAPIARGMPNTAIRIKQSMTCMEFNAAGLKHEHRPLVELVFGSSRAAILHIPENKFAAATVLCGSGTALAMKFIRVFMQAGIQHGFDEKEALRIASQVLKGAAMLIQTDEWKHPEAQIDKVTTPGGCTIAALTELEHAGFSSALLRAVNVGVEKAGKLYS